MSSVLIGTNAPVGCHRPTKSVEAMATNKTYVIARI